MIQKVTTAHQRARFLAAARAHLATNAQMAMRLALFGDLAGSGWQFYTDAPEQDVLANPTNTENTALPVQPIDGEVCQPQDGGVVQAIPTQTQDTPLALALRGSTATVAGEFDPEELGSFLAFLGVERLTTPAQTAPEGYTRYNALFVYALSVGQQLPVPPLQGEFAGQENAFVLDTAPSVAKVIPLLFADGDGDALQFGAKAQAQDPDSALKEQYYADNTMARNAGMAEFWLLMHQGRAIFTLAASAIVEKYVYLSAGETLAPYRGQGIGGHYIVQMANAYAAKGYTVCFVCEAVRCHFYQRLGFAKAGELYQYKPCTCPIDELTLD